VHGYFTGGFGTHGWPTAPAFWKQLRSEVRAFNDAADGDKVQLRELIGLLFRPVGLEIVHIELGQDPHQHDDDQAALLDGAVRQTPRTEHFGYRDNLSQPFVDLGLGDPLSGGGTASRRSSWTPVAPGEIFLDAPDEDGETHELPVHPVLRRGSTFVVFRKLEQDVQGFRAFLERQRPKDPQAQDALGAQFVGRWKNGAPLVTSPLHQPDVGADAEGILNDFRYAADDPDGRKCPLGAHIRRANPRDIGGRNDVRRHRILRRGISYGGPLLPENSAGDGEKRGMLFIAANARIDLQFEVIQADWLNGGEFLGQVGLDRCPLTGANAGTVADRFLEAGAAAPVTGLPRFVHTRGGDYFFLPGIDALKAIAAGETFAVAPEQLPYHGYSMGDAATPSLYGQSRLKLYGQTMLGTPKRIVRIATPGTGQMISFVGRHADVTRVLSDDLVNGAVEFSVKAYHDAGQRITRGSDMLVGTDESGPTCPARHRLRPILDLAWTSLAGQFGPSGSIDAAVRNIAKMRIEAALRRTAHARRIDLVADVAAQASYGVITDLFGLPGPSWVTELGLALPFARQHVGDLPADWLAALKGDPTADPGLTTMQIWSAVLVVDLIGNLHNQKSLQALSRQAGSEMLTHIDARLAEVRGRPGAVPRSLIEAFVLNEALPEIRDLYKHAPAGDDWRSLYYQDVSMILIEIVGSTLVVIPLTFASVMTSLLNMRIAPSALPRHDDEALAAVIYEAERLNPNLPVRMRHCEVDTDWSKEAGITANDTVAALVGAANLDPRAFTDPTRFSLAGAGIGEGPARKPENYLLFGVPGSNKDCWGRNRVAMPVLQECLRACSRLTGLRRVAGAAGEPQKLAGVTIGLLARFTRLAS
jgi:deferrochelatase/peroxidase EfeB/cytochrome P450